MQPLHIVQAVLTDQSAVQPDGQLDYLVLECAGLRGDRRARPVFYLLRLGVSRQALYALKNPLKGQRQAVGGGDKPLDIATQDRERGDKALHISQQPQTIEGAFQRVGFLVDARHQRLRVMQRGLPAVSQG
ncbi:hypothetical protein [Sodalis glossinidius]|uniref:hypothetical protein n=1 Tax=Sodalis glossinidius TaxID=63612 RepID=UPI001FB3A85E|nr:hypothetical protein [Sodalis glossinidius]